MIFTYTYIQIRRKNSISHITKSIDYKNTKRHKLSNIDWLTTSRRNIIAAIAKNYGDNFYFVILHAGRLFQNLID